MRQLPTSVEIRDDTMREGLQIESKDISVEEKLRLLDALGDTGLKVISIGSFVSPKWTPQMASIDELAERFEPKPGVKYTAAVFNRQGFERADKFYPKIDVRSRDYMTHVEVGAIFAMRNYNRTPDQFGSDKVRVAYSRGDRSEDLAVDQVLIAMGRRPSTDALGLERVGVALDERGFVSVDDRHRTSVPTITAIGDVSGAPLLAHKASEEGVAAVEHMAGVDRPPLDPRRIPACVYAQPQVASIGLTEAQAREQHGDAVRIGKFPFSASGKAVAADHTSGFVKLVVNSEFGEIVGAHVVGAGATELIAELSLAMQLEATTAEVAHTVHAHPTLSEAIWEAALSAEGRSLNR